MLYCGDVADVVARISAITEAMILVAAVWELALRFVCTAIGMRPMTASKQKAAIPIANSHFDQKKMLTSFAVSSSIDSHVAAQAADLDRDDIWRGS